MGLVQAAVGAISGSLGDQWKDFYTVSDSVTPTTAISAAEMKGTNAARGSNTASSVAVISNGSKIIVPENYALVLVQDGAFTGFVTEPGAYIWNTEALDSATIFAGNGFWNPLVKNSWERFKFGGRPQSEQQAWFVSLQELGNNKFATPSEIYWDDKFLNTQAGALVRGSYSIKLTDPLTFLKTFVPPTYLKSGRKFDLTDLDNPVAGQLFNEVISSLSAAFARYANGSGQGIRMADIQKDAVGFSRTLAEVIESDYKWASARGISLLNTAIVSIQYDEATKNLLQVVQRADSLTGQRGNSNLQASIAAGIESAGSTEGAAGILGIGFAAGSMGLGPIQQPATSNDQDDVFTKLQNLKKMLDAGLITQDDYDSAKGKFLGL